MDNMVDVEHFSVTILAQVVRFTFACCFVWFVERVASKWLWPQLRLVMWSSTLLVLVVPLGPNVAPFKYGASWLAESSNVGRAFEEEELTPLRSNQADDVKRQGSPPLEEASAQREPSGDRIALNQALVASRSQSLEQWRRMAMMRRARTDVSPDAPTMSDQSSNALTDDEMSVVENESQQTLHGAVVPEESFSILIAKDHWFVAFAKVGFALWLAGVVFATIRIMRTKWKLLRSIEDSRSLQFIQGKTSGAELYQADLRTICELQRRYYPRQRVRVSFSSLVSGAGVIGAIRPRIVLPVDWPNGLRHADQQHVLMHELTHIARRDVLLLSIVRVLVVVFWPLLPIWFVRRRIEDLVEICCDEAVVQAIGDRRSYVATLLRLMRDQYHEQLLVSGFVGQSSQIVKRLKQLTLRGNKRRSRIYLYATPLVCFVASIFTPILHAERTSPIELPICVVLVDDGASLAHPKQLMPDASDSQSVSPSDLGDEPGCLHFRFRVLQRLSEGELVDNHAAQLIQDFALD